MPLTQVSSRLIEDTLRYVLGANGTSDYTFTGKGLTGAVNDPTLTLSRGHTYIFENRNASGQHPFYIKTSIANGGTNDAYNTGVTNNGGAGGTEIVFTVPHDAPDLLYYQCSSHINMAGQLKIAGAVADGSITTAKLEDSTGTTDGVTTAKIADDAVTSAKIASSSVTNDSIANDSIHGDKISTETISLSKLVHGTSSNDGKFLRANNGADPSFESLPASGLSNVVEDTTPQLGGDLASNGNDILLAANDRAVFGTDKLRVKHTDSNADIENTTGNIVIKNDSSSTSEQIILQAKGGADSIKAIADGAVELYHAGNKKLETVTGGATITGTCTATAFSGDGSALTNLPGITMTDSWQITADFTGDSNPISSNWKRADQTLAGNLGTGLTESSGVFTFPSTGYYYVIWTHSNRNTGTSTYQYMHLQITSNNSSYSDWGFTAGFHRAGSGAWHWTKNVEAAILDITDTSNQKMRFRVDNENGNTVTMGDANAKRTGFEIIRLGDT